MRAVLVDAGPLVALLHDDDVHHSDCVEAIGRIEGTLITVWPVLAEAMHLLAFSESAQDKLLDMVEAQVVEIAALGIADVPRMRELMRKYHDRPMDLADAALVRLAEREGIREILTIDRTDFGVYRLHGRQRFTIVP